MPRNRREQLLAQDAARKLQTLLSSARVMQLLQQAPPAALTAQQAAVTASCCTAVQQVLNCLRHIEDGETAVQLLSALLRYDAFRSVGTLLVWAQQQPLQLQLSLLRVTVAPTTIEGVWVLCYECIRFVVPAIAKLERSSKAQITAQLTQQLHRSGGCRWFNTCTSHIAQ
jgi:hypothetical protein